MYKWCSLYTTWFRFCVMPSYTIFFILFLRQINNHFYSSEIRGLRLMKLPNLPYFWKMNIKLVCSNFHFMLIYFSNVAYIERREKCLSEFSHYQNYDKQIIFEVFCWLISSSLWFVTIFYYIKKVDFTENFLNAVWVVIRFFHTKNSGFLKKY